MPSERPAHALTTARGRVRKPAPNAADLWPHEIEPGRSVPNNWDKHLVETWADRKARRAREAGKP